MDNVGDSTKLNFGNPVEKIVQVAAKRWNGLMQAYEDPEVMNHPAVLGKLQWESQIVNSITQAANNVVKDLTEPLKAIVNKG
jgi:hypothetical protein